MKKILIIGHSHMQALRTAQTADTNFAFHSLIKQGSEPVYQLNPNDYESIVFLIGGNYHNILGLINNPVPFDFYLPDYPALPLMDGARLLPVKLIENNIKKCIMAHLILMQQFVDYFQNKTFYQLESPPLLPESHIINNGGIFKEKISQLGIAPASFRYKLWRLHSAVIEQHCHKIGINFVNAPPESQDDTGFLKPLYWHKDPSHANAHYGELVLNQLRALHQLPLKFNS